MARPNKLTPEVRDKLIDLIASGVSIESAAALVGVAARTVHRWIADGAEAKKGWAMGFAAAIAQAKAQAEIRLVLQLNKAATKGNVKAAIWLLERVRPDLWGPKRMEEARESAEEFAIKLRATLAAMDATIARPPGYVDPSPPRMPPG